MNKLKIAAAACLMATLAMAQTNEVTSVNVVGYYKVTIPPAGGFTLVALNLDSIDPTNQNIQGIFGTQLRSGSNPNNSDKLYKYLPSGGGYKTFFRKTSTGLYYSSTDLVNATNPAILTGEGMWLQSQPSATTNYDITLMGEVVSLMTQNVSLVSGLQMSGYPFSTDVALNSTLLRNGKAGSNPNNSDNIYYWNGTGYVNFFLKANGWYNSQTLTGPVTNVITMGSGFWYLARTNSSFVWSETNSYAGNL
jgi:hypothetical protein